METVQATSLFLSSYFFFFFPKAAPEFSPGHSSDLPGEWKIRTREIGNDHSLSQTCNWGSDWNFSKCFISQSPVLASSGEASMIFSFTLGSMEKEEKPTALLFTPTDSHRFLEQILLLFGVLKSNLHSLGYRTK